MDHDTGTVVFNEDQPTGSGPVRRGSVAIEGRRYPAWHTGDKTAHTTCWLTESSIVLQHWRFEPQYDSEPVVERECHALAKFLADAPQPMLVVEFGENGTRQIVAEAERVRPRPSPGRRLALFGHWLLERLRELWPTDLATLIPAAVGIVLALVVLSTAAGKLWRDGSLWWHARVVKDLIPVRARVLAHDLEEHSGDGSWGHKSNSSRKKWYYAHPIVELEYAYHESEPPIRARGTVPEKCDSRDATFQYLNTHFPVGAEPVIHLSPHLPESFLFSLNDAPTFLGMIGSLLLAAVYFIFIQLPLIVLLVLLLPLVGELIIWLLRKLRLLPAG